MHTAHIHAVNPTLPTHQQLTQVTTKMKALQYTLTHDKTARNNLYRALTKTEQQISTHTQTLHTIQHDLEKKQQATLNLQRAVNANQQQLRLQQHALANHARARYYIGEALPLQWLLNPDAPQAIDQRLTYYQYIIQADQRLIRKIQETTQTLALNQNSLNQDLIQLKQLKNTLLQQQNKLEQMKHQHHTVIHALDQSIQTKQEVLADCRQNQAHLQTLLNKLSKPALSHLPRRAMRAPLMRFNGTFASPLKTTPTRTQQQNQGILLFAHQGTPVSAILPGKVVFSDWLNGYGLLLIIDHGQGMMSLYAHNESLFKPKGTFVKQGDQIATVGHSGGLRENGLYFELRRRGKVVPPRQWLS